MKTMPKLIFVILLSLFCYTSCEEAKKLLPMLTEEDMVKGIKTALEVGTDSSTNFLSADNGYYKNDLLKIPLPQEAEQIRKLITDNDLAKVLNLDSYFEDVVKAVNRAAESAAKDASPVFKGAITSMSIKDALKIVQGVNPADTRKSGESYDSTAATNYFISTTKTSLINIYSPKINTALDNDLGLGFSANTAWNKLTTKYNEKRNSTLAKTAILLAGVELPENINSDLGEFCVDKALTGLFHKVGEEEKQIRRDPFQWSLDILHRVFGKSEQ